VKYRIKLLTLYFLLILSILHIPKFYSGFNVAYVRGTVYDAETGEPLEGVLVEYYIVFQSQNEHWGYPIESAVTDEKGFFEIELNEVEKQIGSEAEYTLEQILSNGFLLIAYKEGYLRCYSAINLFKPQYHYWSSDKNVKVVSLRMYKDFPLKSIKEGSIEAVYHFEYQKEAAEKLLYYTKVYLNILKDKLGVNPENENILIKFDMGVKSEGAGHAHFSIVGPCEVVVDWYPWITDPINENYYLLLIHELIHIFQPRLNSKNVPVWLSAGWISEGQAVAISNAIIHEMGKDGASFEEQAVEPGVDYPQSYEDFIDITGENYARWAKMFSKIVVDYGKGDEWGFIRRFMQYLDEFVEKDAVLKDWDKPYPLSDYEVILLLSLAACQNLTDLFTQVFNYPAESLSQQRRAYLKYYVAKQYLSSLPADKQVEFKHYFNEGVKNFIERKYEEAEEEFDKAFALVEWDNQLPDIIFSKCFAEIFEVIINFKTTYPENFNKYFIYLDSEPIESGKPVKVSKGKHEIEIYYKQVKIYEEYFEVQEDLQKLVKVREYKLKLQLPGTGPTWKVTILRDNAIMEALKVSENSIVLLLPEGNYKVVVESRGMKWSREVSLARDTTLKIGKASILRLSIKDRFGNPVQATVLIDNEKFEVKDSVTLELEKGEYLLQIYWNKILVTRKYVKVGEEEAVEDIIIEFANLKVKTRDSEGEPLEGCIVSVYWSGNLLLAQATEASGEAEFKLPKQRYEILISCHGDTRKYQVNLEEDVMIEYLEERSLSGWIFLAIIAAIVSIILLVIFIFLKRKSKTHNP